MRVLLVFFMSLASVGGVGAQQSSGEGRAVTLQGCLVLALERNPGLQASQARLDGAYARVTETRSGMFPQLKFTGRWMELSEVPSFSLALPPPIGTQTLFPAINHSYAGRVSLQQTLFAGFRVRRGLEASEFGASASEQEYRRDRADVVLKVSSAYWNLVRAVQMDSAIAQAVQQIESHLTDVRNLRGQGLVSDLDVLKVETRLSEMNVRHIESRSAIRLAAMLLNSLMGTDLLTPLHPVDHPSQALADSVESKRPLEIVLRDAQERRAEVIALQERRNAQESALGAANGGWYPQILLTAGYEYARPNSRFLPPRDQWEKSWDVGVQVQWNLWDWFATASQADQARAGLRQAEAGLAQVRDGVAIEAAQSYFKLVEARERVQAASQGVRQAAESERIARERFRLGLTTSTELLDVETALLNARLGETQALIDYALQVQYLKRAVGDPL